MYCIHTKRLDFEEFEFDGGSAIDKPCDRGKKIPCFFQISYSKYSVSKENIDIILKNSLKFSRKLTVDFKSLHSPRTYCHVSPIDVATYSFIQHFHNKNASNHESQWLF